MEEPTGQFVADVINDNQDALFKTLKNISAEIKQRVKQEIVQYINTPIPSKVPQKLLIQNCTNIIYMAMLQNNDQEEWNELIEFINNACRYSTISANNYSCILIALDYLNIALRSESEKVLVDSTFIKNILKFIKSLQPGDEKIANCMQLIKHLPKVYTDSLVRQRETVITIFKAELLDIIAYITIR
ncbi:hypothetical protein DFA_12112 [Cavenderia fasciculata]|uniref:Uncharacterized protein n=1 Tax=Cavenderia fasciculata TaxID=261658 RepID=F4QFU5_CACFS|nr:uncharacterized protein DFA_12112 [Cavenderia fasciculata]EGG14342.1 hypothetical protein DFA_12112 [Cavenderia fasciculata]|eukprot:XP_004351051.1 hypothetical protein DFA_12112 [Cavenderia fasciculata]